MRGNSRPSGVMDEEDPANEGNLKNKQNPNLDLSSPEFDASQFLATIHAATTFSNLQNELKELVRTTSDKTEQLKALVSAHFDQYLSCHEAVRSLAEEIRTHEKENDDFLREMKNLKDITDSSLSIMLKRSKEQRRIRNTLSVLSRFRSIFEIISKMKENLITKDYEKLAEGYCRLKYHHTKSNMTALHKAFEAAQNVALTANEELLQKFDDLSLSVKDQRRAITVLEELGFVDKPTLTCLKKQFEVIEKKLTTLEVASNIITTSTITGTPLSPRAITNTSASIDANEIVRECCAIIYRFRSGLWGFICDIFKSCVVSSAEAEQVQQKAWWILEKSVFLVQSNAVRDGIYLDLLKQLNEAFLQMASLKKCPNANFLNTKVQEMKKHFCEEFRLDLCKKFIIQETRKSHDRLMKGYFNITIVNPNTLTAPGSPILMSPPTSPTNKQQQLPVDISDLELLTAVSSSSSGEFQLTTINTQRKIQRILREALDTCEQRTSFAMISADTKIHTSRATVLTDTSMDLYRHWQFLWKRISQGLLEMVQMGASGAFDDISSSGPSTTTGFSSSSSGAATATTAVTTPGMIKSEASFCQALVNEFKGRLHDHLSQFLTEFYDFFQKDLNASHTIRRQKVGCMLFVIISNCIEMRENLVPEVSEWIKNINPTSTNFTELTCLLQEIEKKCLDTYISIHSEPFLDMLRAGAAEEALSRSITATSASTNPNAPLNPTATSTSTTSNSTVPTDGRQYVFNILMLLVTLRSEIENCLGGIPQCSEYVHKVFSRLTDIMVNFLEDATKKCTTTTTTTSCSTTNDLSTEWTRIHLTVEIRFFLFALEEILTENNKTKLNSFEKILQPKTNPNERAMTTLLGQMKHQTKLYLLCLHS